MRRRSGMHSKDSGQEIRLDKWLWTARFFKTRALAAQAINGGKVQIQGGRTKPGRKVKPGVCLRIRKGALEWEVVVRGLSQQRRPAVEAQLLYEETEDSRKQREQRAEDRRAAARVAPAATARPTKRDRRRWQRLTGESS